MGKNWAEADADVAETIDFLEFYAREALRLAAAPPSSKRQEPGEAHQREHMSQREREKIAESELIQGQIMLMASLRLPLTIETEVDCLLRSALTKARHFAVARALVHHR